MPVPSLMSDLSTTAGSNSPAGTEAIGTNLDNYLRAQASLIRQSHALASASIAAASTVDVGSSDGESVSITGAATITSLGTGFNGCRRELRFAGICTLTHSANLVLPSAANITTVAGDILTFRCTGSGQWAMVNASRSGSVTSVAVSGGTTGLSTSGGPITSSGTITLAGTLAVANGGTGGTTATTARAGLGLGSSAVTNQTVSTSAPSGTPADGDRWLVYTP